MVSSLVGLLDLLAKIAMLADKENVGSNPNVMMFSPPKAKRSKDAEKSGRTQEKMESIICAKFQHPMKVDFDSVDINEFASLQFLLINPDEKNGVRVTVDKVPEGKGLEVLLGAKGEKEIVIPPKGKTTGVITWSPMANTALREKATLKLDNKHSTQIIINGRAGTGKVSTHNILYVYIYIYAMFSWEWTLSVRFITKP